MYYADSIISIVTPLLLIYILLFIVLMGQRYLRIYSRNKTLKFTQEELKDKKREISHLKNLIKNDECLQSEYHFEILSLYNELAVGINEGIYDELYIRMVMGNEMTIIFKQSNSLNTFANNDIIFMPLELLLKRWDNNEGPSYRIKNVRRFK